MASLTFSCTSRAISGMQQPYSITIYTLAFTVLPSKCKCTPLEAFSLPKKRLMPSVRPPLMPTTPGTSCAARLATIQITSSAIRISPYSSLSCVSAASAAASAASAALALIVSFIFFSSIYGTSCSLTCRQKRDSVMKTVIHYYLLIITHFIQSVCIKCIKNKCLAYI